MTATTRHFSAWGHSRPTVNEMDFWSTVMTLYERHVSKNKDALTFFLFQAQDHNVFQCKRKFLENIKEVICFLFCHWSKAEMLYCQISKAMSLLYFGLDVFYTFWMLEPQNLTWHSFPQLHQCFSGRGFVSNLRAVASNRQKTASSKYNDDISLLT